MMDSYFTAMIIVQLAHSLEELLTGFHKKFPLFPMSFRFFLTFELLFNLFWVSVLLLPNFPYRDTLMASFILLMFANGLWHVVWSGIVKKYVPGLLTAPIFIVIFLLFYFQVLVKMI